MDLHIRNYDDMNIKLSIQGICIDVVDICKVYPCKDWHASEHSHALYEFHIVPKGKGYVNIEGRDFTVSGGELYFTGPNVRHAQKSDTADPMMEYCMRCEIGTHEKAPETYTSHDADTFTGDECNLIIEALSGVCPYIFKDRFRVASKFEEAFKEADERKPGFFLRIRVLVMDIILALFRTAIAGNRETSRPVPEKPLVRRRLDRIINYIEVNYMDDISAGSISKYMFLSAKQINRILKRELNKTFHDLVLDCRIKAAVRLIKETDLPIREVAFKSGFSSHFYLYQVFRRKGIDTPIRLRSKNGK